jgi:hypothetical protein
MSMARCRDKGHSLLCVERTMETLPAPSGLVWKLARSDALKVTRTSIRRIAGTRKQWDLRLADTPDWPVENPKDQ